MSANFENFENFENQRFLLKITLKFLENSNNKSEKYSKILKIDGFCQK